MIKRDRRSNRRILLNIEQRIGILMSAVADLEAAVTALEGDESAVATEFATLATEITELKAGSISEAQIESLAEKASAVDTALKAATPSGTE